MQHNRPAWTLFRAVGMATTMALTVTATVTASPAVPPPPSDPITAWSVRASAAMADAGMSPLRQPLTLALVHLAMHDAVASSTHAFRPYAASLPIEGLASAEAAVAEAAFTILVAEVPSARAAL